MRCAVVFLLLSAFLAGFALAADESSGGARLIVRKFVEPLPAAVGRNATVTVEVFNAGSSTATDVEIIDAPPPLEYFETFPESSPLTKKIARVAAGATAKLEYFASPLSPTQGTLDPAAVSYKSSGSDETITTSSAAALVYSVSLLDSYAHKALKFGATATGGAITTPQQWRGISLTFGLIFAFFFGGKIVSLFRDAGKSRRYKKALAEVEKMK